MELKGRRLPVSPRRAKKHKKTYFFQPTNNLVHGENLELQNPLEEAQNPKKTLVSPLKPAVLPPTATLSADPNSPRIENPVQSSDDSFDGIKWRTTPRKAQLGHRNVPSSPLREVAKDSLNSRANHTNTHSATLTDEQANSVLNKYGTDFVNISSQPTSTPNLQKTTSDISESTSKNNELDKSPILQRSRSSGTEKLAFKPSLVASKSMTKSLMRTLYSESAPQLLSQPPGFTLNNWINRFDSNLNELDQDANLDFTKLMLHKQESAADSIPESVSAGIEDIDFSDDFSDSELVASDAKSDRKTTPETESDPFSSDDEIFNGLGGAQSNLLSSEPKFTPQSSTTLACPREGFSRYRIDSFVSTKYKVNGKTLTQLVMTVIDPTGATSKLLIRGESSLLNFEKGDIVHIIVMDPGNPRLVDDNHNLLIWNPDTLVSPTSVSQQLSCARKSVLSSRLKFPGESSIYLITGTILHEIFQNCIQTDDWSYESMNSLSQSLIDERRIEIFSLGEEMLSKVHSSIQDQLPYLHEWFETYYKKIPTLASIIPSTSTPTSSRPGNRKQSIMFAVSRAFDIEETIWSPMFGLNGKIDVTIEATIKYGSNKSTKLMPLEIKTGREHISHHAQSALYTLLFKDRYEIDLVSFLLVYTKEKLTKEEEIGRNDLKSLVNLRNQFTEFFKLNTRSLPNLLQLSICDRCEIQQACMTINYLSEGGTGEDSGIGPEDYSLLVEHLSEDHKHFYNTWDTVITKEEGSMSRRKCELWLMSSKEREETNGMCLSNLVVSDSSKGEHHWYEYTFRRSETSKLQNRSFQLGQLSKNDRVIISSENGHYALTQGYIIKLRPDFIVISAMRKLSPPSKVTGRYRDNPSAPGLEFRIDKDEMFYGMGLARFNILNLFLADGDLKRRKILIENKNPQFTNEEFHYEAPNYLNIDQVTAIEKVLLADDFALILGMPGSGKTTVIAELIKYLVKNGKSVVLTSYTHSAVDNILLKLVDCGIGILRIGSPSKVHRDIQKFLPTNILDYEDFERTYLQPQVVASTCLGIDDIAFSLGRKFDYCILDEASQVTMPVSLGPLRFCEKFVLVGDHHQLPPLVQNQDVQVRRYLSTSLFKTLGDLYPDSVASLTFQFRMCEDIMLLSNTLVYENRLKCGSPAVANRFLKIPEPSKVLLLLSSSPSSEQEQWMNRILDRDSKVVFLNHDDIPGYETCIGDKIENETEANLIFQIVDALTTCGVAELSIGVMALYRSQLRLLLRGLSDKSDIECLTADQFQGRDKDCVVISLVRSNKELKLGDLLKEWRRINVAITRSKSKLIILGSAAMMKSVETLSKVTSLLEQKNWIYNLRPNALSVYKKKIWTDSPQKKRVIRGVGSLKGQHITRDIFHSLS